MLSSVLQTVDFASPSGDHHPSLLPTARPTAAANPREGGILLEAARIKEVDYVFFRRFSDLRTSEPAAYVVDNTDEHLSCDEVADLHNTFWVQGLAPLVYVVWPTRLDILTCARGPDFWQGNRSRYNPAATIATATQANAELEKAKRFSAERLEEGTFWDDPRNAELADHKKSAHWALTTTIVELDDKLDGEKNPVLRRLLLLTVLVKYLEDRRVFPAGWFAAFYTGANSFFDVLRQQHPGPVLELLKALELKFNGDVFTLPMKAENDLTPDVLGKFAELVEARTLSRQRYLWKRYSFEHLPVEMISHLYQRFVQDQPGSVYTPPFLAELLLDQVMPYSSLQGDERVLDPACGSGVFLVGAFRRLVTAWRSRNRWQRPSVKRLKTILGRSIFGVDLDEGAIDLAAFSLSLAICDALRPNVIWEELQFGRLRSKNLFREDFFAHTASRDQESEFDVIVGNPPFGLPLTKPARKLDRLTAKTRGPLPDKQIAYLFLEQSARLMSASGRLCLIQPHGFLYNKKTASFRESFLASAITYRILDFVSIRGLYDGGSDPKTVAILAGSTEHLAGENLIEHLTFRRSFRAYQRLGFEIDNYDRHVVRKEEAIGDESIWRSNLLGGGRLADLSRRIRKLQTLQEYVEKERGWLFKEGFIAGKKSTKERPREPAAFLTGRPLLPTRALTLRGIDESKIETVEETLFLHPRKEALYTGPVMMIKEHKELPSAFRETGFLAFKDKIVGISAKHEELDHLRKFFELFQEKRPLFRFCCLLNGTQVLLGKSTALLKTAIAGLPWPKDASDLEFSFWEQTLQQDVVRYMDEYIRLGQNSKLLRNRAEKEDLKSYSELFCKLLGSVYRNLNSGEPSHFDGLICVPWFFGESPTIELNQLARENLRDLITHDQAEVLRTLRTTRIYFRNENLMLIVKPDRLRYWIPSTAIRDADETLVDLFRQGH